MNTSEEAHLGVEFEIDAYPRNEDVNAVGSDPVGALPPGVTGGEIGPEQFDVFVSEAGTQGPSTQLELILDKQRPGRRFVDAIGLTAGGSPGGEHHVAVNHLKPVFVLKPIFLVLVVAKAQFEIVLGEVKP